MSTAVIVVIIVVAALIVLGLLTAVALMPRMRRRGAEHRMDERRSVAAGRHRSEAEAREMHADMAEQEARRARAEADLHESRAELHERGMADEELGDPADPRFERDRELVDDEPAGERPERGRRA